MLVPGRDQSGMGPVPINFNSIFEYLANNDDVDIYYTTFRNGGAGEQFKSNPNRKLNLELFTENELIVLECTSMRFKNTSTNEIVNTSHKERAWIENESEKKIIDYTYSFDLN